MSTNKDDCLPIGYPSKASWESLQQGALDHYEELATKAHHWNSFIPAAIKAYKNPEANNITPTYSPADYLLWLDMEIERLQSHYKEVDVPGNEKYALSVMVQWQALQRARNLFITIQFPSQLTDA